MRTFEDFNLNKPLTNAVLDLGFEKPTPIQSESFPVILSGRDMVGIAQTGTGKTFAYMMPLLKNLKYSNQLTPRIVVLVPTRELVLQVVEHIESYIKYTNLRVLGVYGGVAMKKHKAMVAEGMDILVSTPARIYDLALTNVLQLNTVKKLVIDEVDIMLDLGYRFQLKNLFEILPEKRQNIMFSATMTEEVDALIDDYFVQPEKISIAVSGTPLENITQECYNAKNFLTKVNLLYYLLSNEQEFKKVLIFISSRVLAEKLHEALAEVFGSQVGLIHANKTQSFRVNSLADFNEDRTRILVATDVIARGLDLEKISHVINFDTPHYPENYMHRIGRTGRAEEKGHSILLYSAKELERKQAIEQLMSYTIPEIPFPGEVDVTSELIPEEKPKPIEVDNISDKLDDMVSGPAFHEKKDKNKKENQGGSYRRELAAKYKKPKTRGDKNFNRRYKKK